MPKLDEYFHPKSMITPGVAGLSAMIIANAMWKSFGLPPHWVALVVSFLIAVAVIRAGGTPGLQRMALYGLNTLVIYSCAVGTNLTGGVAMAARPEPAASASLIVTPNLSDLASREPSDTTRWSRAVAALDPATVRDLVSGNRLEGVDVTLDGRSYRATASVVEQPAYVLDPTSDAAGARQLHDPVRVTLVPTGRAFFSPWFRDAE